MTGAEPENRSCAACVLLDALLHKRRQESRRMIPLLETLEESPPNTPREPQGSSRRPEAWSRAQNPDVRVMPTRLWHQCRIIERVRLTEVLDFRG
jgi:hypothetical protein